MENNGISFIVRIRNEEAVLEQSIRSLSQITVPHEIVLILHLCTDGSAQIAERLAGENPNIRIMTYDVEISRPGYETLATDENSKHSVVTYYNWWIRQAKYPWVFKWDADFLASPELVSAINNEIWTPKNMYVTIVAKNSTSSNREAYLVGGERVYKKYIFWENNMFNGDIKQRQFDDHVNITHASELSVLKSYWRDSPWFEREDSDEARLVKSRVDRLTADFGPEPQGMARASNPECDAAFMAISSANNGAGPSYVQMFI
jgi:glycosyltransferase involved in cell wall biosynthesis